MSAKRNLVSGVFEQEVRACKVRRPSSTMSARNQTENLLSSVCSRCRAILGSCIMRADQCIRSFYTYAGLKASAAEECRLCALILLSLKERPDTHSSSRTRIQLRTRLFPRRGISFYVALLVGSRMPIISTFNLIFLDHEIVKGHPFTSFSLQGSSVGKIPGSVKDPLADSYKG